VCTTYYPKKCHPSLRSATSLNICLGETHKLLVTPADTTICMVTVHYCHHTGDITLRCEFLTVDKYILRDCVESLSVCHPSSSHFPSALISCLYEPENKYIFHAAVIFYVTLHTHTHTHTQSRARSRTKTLS